MEQAGCSGLNLNVAGRAAILHWHKRKIIIFKGNLVGSAAAAAAAAASSASASQHPQPHPHPHRLGASDSVSALQHQLQCP